MKVKSAKNILETMIAGNQAHTRGELHFDITHFNKGKEYTPLGMRLAKELIEDVTLHEHTDEEVREAKELSVKSFTIGNQKYEYIEYFDPESYADDGGIACILANGEILDNAILEIKVDENIEANFAGQIEKYIKYRVR